MAQAEQIRLDDVYIAPLWVGVNLNLVSPRVTGWLDNAVDIHLARYLCMTPAGPANRRVGLDLDGVPRDDVSHGRS